MIILIFSSYYLDYDTKPNNNSFNISESTKEEIVVEEPIVEEIKDYSGKFKYCIFVFNESYQRYVEEHEYIFDDFCNISEKYPYISDLFYPEYNVEIREMDKDYVLAWYIGNGNIEINKKYWTLKTLDEVLSHEIIHSVTEDLWLPNWLDEGIAEYYSYYFLDQVEQIRHVYIKDVELWNNSDDYGRSVKAYKQSRYIVKKMIERFGDDFIYKLLVELEGKISPYDTIEEKNDIIFDAIREVADNESITRDEILFPQDY
ncbi:hypothetical protein ACFLZB_00460 [Nanoarchaeota archaeon]